MQITILNPFMGNRSDNLMKALGPIFGKMQLGIYEEYLLISLGV